MRTFGAILCGAALAVGATPGCGDGASGAAGAGGASAGSTSTAGGASTAGSTSAAGGASTAASTSTSSATSGSATSGTGGATNASAGCGKPGAPKGVQKLSIDSGGTRTYALSVPDAYDPSVPLALVFGWHGIGGTGSNIRPYLGLEKPASGKAIFVYPDALQLASANGATGWDLDSNGIDVALFDKLESAIEGAYCVSTDRVFSAGYSHGGYMSNLLGCVRGDRLRGIAPIAGGGPFGDGCKGPVAAMVIHGTSDQTVSLDQGIASRDHWLEANGCGADTKPLDPAPCVAYQGCSAGHPVAWCQHDGDHVVPDFGGQAVWSFFEAL